MTGVILRATIRQEFANPSSEWAEGVYVSRLPEDAVRAGGPLRYVVGAEASGG